MNNKIFFAVLIMIASSLAIQSQNLSSNTISTRPWVDSLIAKGSYGKSPISEIKSYIYNNKLVYLISYDAGCCDKYSAVLLDETGHKICHPYGGISGRGDMQCVDFNSNSTEPTLIWTNPNFTPIINTTGAKPIKMKKEG